MPWKTAAGRYIGKSKHDKAFRSYTDTFNQMSAAGAPHGTAFAMANMAAQAKLDESDSAGKKDVER